MKNLLLTVLLCFVSLTSFSQVESDTYQGTKVYSVDRSGKKETYIKSEAQFGGFIGSTSKTINDYYSTNIVEEGVVFSSLCRLRPHRKIYFDFESGLIVADYIGNKRLYGHINASTSLALYTAKKGFRLGYDVGAGIALHPEYTDGGLLLGIDCSFPVSSKTILIRSLIIHNRSIVQIGLLF